MTPKLIEAFAWCAGCAGSARPFTHILSTEPLPAHAVWLDVTDPTRPAAVCGCGFCPLWEHDPVVLNAMEQRAWRMADAIDAMDDDDLENT